ncbi:dihydrofolate reductase family protein [Zobellia uliginosa]|uniref:dihydrofolate reductase family protein n=1 Tax=Zobellia uliginosa TaxID=143224 RepID=UPI0026E139DA|nr:dihydrofolate reductase family protein [Zobellia uliginosa]MDO6519541.1 dihydrofolate reductase family protein [Zobellia uliginosa]
MRKLKLQIQLSIDGFISGPNGEMDWIIWNWDEKLKNFVKEITESTDTIVLGRKLAEGFIPHWKSNKELEGAEKINNSNKIVFTKTLENTEWENTLLEKGDLVEKIEKLKSSTGYDIIAYGGGEFVSSLIKENLIDEYYFFINPSILGKGMPIFKKANYKTELKLEGAKAYECGITVLIYKK